MSIIQTIPHLSKGQSDIPFIIPTVGTHTAIKILHKINEFRADRTLCDFILQCDDGTRISAHRLVLSAVSPYFETMFQANMAEKGQLLVNIKGIDSNTLSILVDFAYTTEITVSVENIFNLLTAANMLCFEEVEQSCIEFLCRSLNLENCVDICTIAEMINCEELHRMATLFVSSKFRQLVKDISFVNLTPLQLETVLSNDNLNVTSEAEVFDAVMTWVQCDKISRAEYLSILLRHVRFPLMSRKYLVDRVLHEDLIMQQEASRDLVLKALDHHLLPERTVMGDFALITMPRQVTNRTLFVLGGEVKGKARSSVEYFDFMSNTWRRVTSMLMPRKHAAVAVLDGVLYAIGGINDSMDLITCEKYDPSTELWSPVASLKQCRGALNVTVVDGWLYALGGSNGKEAIKTAEQYDPLSNSWTALPPMRLPRSHFGVAELHGRIYAIGGYCGISEVEHCEYFEPSSGKWFEITGLNKSRMNHAVVCCKERIYAIGGKNSMGVLNSIEKFNPDLNMWLIIKTKVKLSVGMNACLGFQPNHECEEVYVLGGKDNDDEEQDEVKLISLKSPDYVVSKSIPMLETRSYVGAALL